MDHIPTAVYHLTVDMVTLYCNSTKRQNKQPGSHKVVILLDLFNPSVGSGKNRLFYNKRV